MATLMAFLKPFLSIKLRNRTAMYGADVKAATTAAGLVEGVASLPVLYGGSLENFDPAWHLREVPRLLVACKRQGSRNSAIEMALESMANFQYFIQH